MDKRISCCPQSERSTVRHGPWLPATGRPDRDEGLRQLSGFRYDLRMERLKRDSRFRKGAFYPKPDRPVQLQPSVSTNFATSQHEIMLTPTPGRRPVQEARDAQLQPFCLGNPPNPYVGVQQNHCRASQSSPAIGSNGSWNSRTESRRLRASLEVNPGGFDNTKTSTGWPGSKGRSFRTNSPFSPTESLSTVRARPQYRGFADPLITKNYATAAAPAWSFSASALSVCSQLNVSSDRPKWPKAAVLR